jgi:cellulose synthase/poly-beta-1,6-N-acetylglucosamine synthase-like glycosyltransferase
MDGGAEPASDSIYNLYLSMESDPSLGGACGYMSIRMEDVKQEDEVHMGWILNYLFDIHKC